MGGQAELCKAWKLACSVGVFSGAWAQIFAFHQVLLWSISAFLIPVHIPFAYQRNSGTFLSSKRNEDMSEGACSEENSKSFHVIQRENMRRRGKKSELKLEFAWVVNFNRKYVSGNGAESSLGNSGTRALKKASWFRNSVLGSRILREIALFSSLQNSSLDFFVGRKLNQQNEFRLIWRWWGINCKKEERRKEK